MNQTFNDTIEKVYFQIAEACEIIGVEASTLRYWEATFRLNVIRKHGNKRFYTRENIEDLRRIHQLLKVDGYTTSGALRKFRTVTPIQ